MQGRVKAFELLRFISLHRELLDASSEAKQELLLNSRRMLEIKIDPGRHGKHVFASLEYIQIG
ncbi:hypothetical protein SAMN05444167_0989 [Terriglobus roseus]|uniref:Uncharacterized protein n=1 Tax=Terriglobus roseus TaxID=392734 RepID=A0A1G7HAB9_9BACT|nr:hypothetical protein SAMN05444167_0989 [Terriglobus roseus]